jgi:hypothetical protein
VSSITPNSETFLWDTFFSATRAKFLGKPKSQTYRTPKTWDWVKGLQGDQGSGTRCEFAATLGTFAGSTDLPFGSLDTITVQDAEITTTGWVNWFTKANLCGISEQKMKAMARLVRRQLHDASLEKQLAATKKAAEDAKAAKKAAEEAEAAGKAKKLAGKAEDGEDSSSSGDSCSKSSDDSRESEDTYQRDSFCDSDEERNGRDGGDGDGDDGDGDDGDDGDGSGDDSRSSANPLSRQNTLHAPNVPPYSSKSPSFIAQPFSSPTSATTRCTW